MLYKPRHNRQQIQIIAMQMASFCSLRGRRGRSSSSSRDEVVKGGKTSSAISQHLLPLATPKTSSGSTAQTAAQTLAATAPTAPPPPSTTSPSLSANFAGQLFHGQTQRAVWRRSWTRALASLLLLSPLLWQQLQLLQLLLLLLLQLQVQLQSAIGNWRNAGQDYAIV